MILESNVFNNIIYIGITGSIGRGEKSITDKCINDVDFFVIADNVNPILKLQLEKKLQEITKTIFTDILYLNTKKISKKLKNHTIDQYLFDIIHGNMKLYSNSNLLDSTKNNNYTLSLLSAKEVLLSRLWALVVPYSIQDNILLPIKNETFSLYQMKKAYSAIIDAVLILEEQYSSPLKSIKLINFRKTKFYLKYKKENDLLLSYTYQKYNLDIFKSLILLYKIVIHNLIGKELNLITYPRKTLVIKSFFRKTDRSYLDSMFLKFKQLNILVNYMNNKNINIEEFNKINTILYKEVIK
jgi:hypothetical protein